MIQALGFILVLALVGGAAMLHLYQAEQDTWRTGNPSWLQLRLFRLGLWAGPVSVQRQYGLVTWSVTKCEVEGKSFKLTTIETTHSTEDENVYWR